SGAVPGQIRVARGAWAAMGHLPLLPRLLEGKRGGAGAERRGCGTGNGVAQRDREGKALAGHRHRSAAAGIAMRLGALRGGDGAGSSRLAEALAHRPPQPPEWSRGAVLRSRNAGGSGGETRPVSEGDAV